MINSVNEYMVKTRRDLHQIPEIGPNIPETISYVSAELDKMGIEYIELEKVGIVATIGGGEKTLLLREDMDALPIVEVSGEEFASTNGNMHACGHDLHTAMLLGAAKVLKEREAELKCKVVLFFESDEEKGASLETLKVTKYFENMPLDGCLALHCLPLKEMGPGKYVCFEGPANTSINKFSIKVIGKTAHGAVMHEGRNPINVMSHIYNAIQTIAPLEVDSRHCAFVSVCYFRAGKPEAANVIPAEAVMGGTIRGFITEDVRFLMKRVSEVAKGIANSFGMECEIEVSNDFPAAMNSPEMVELVNGIASELGMENVAIPPQMTSDSFGYFSELCPGAYIWIGTGGEEEKYEGGVLHSPKVCFNEETLPYGANILIETALRFGN